MDHETTLPAALASHAAATPEEPWLFFRRGYDWGWRSWSQVADQVARGAEVLHRSGALRTAASPAVPAARIAFADRADPDSVAVVLAIQAAGGVAVAVDGRGAGAESAWARVGDPGKTDAGLGVATPGEVVLPTVPSRLARWTPDLESLRREAPGAGIVFAPERDAAPRAAGDLWRSARAWQASLPEVQLPAAERPIALASAAVGRPFRHVLLAWTLLTGAAWVIEADPETFVTAALRNRPTWVLAPGSDAGLLALGLRERRHRRWHRLRAVGVTDDAPAEITMESDWRHLGVPVLRLSET